MMPVQSAVVYLLKLVFDVTLPIKLLFSHPDQAALAADASEV